MGPAKSEGGILPVLDPDRVDESLPLRLELRHLHAGEARGEAARVGAHPVDPREEGQEGLPVTAIRSLEQEVRDRGGHVVVREGAERPGRGREESRERGKDKGRRMDAAVAKQR